MGRQVSNLSLALQGGSDSTLVATWDFSASVTTTTSGVKAGDWVTVREGATWYNGATIPDWVLGQEWRVSGVSGDRAVIDENRSGSNHINSPINVADLQGGSGASSTTTEDTLSGYTYTWFYDVGDGTWYVGKHADDDECPNNYATYSVPDSAVRVHFHVIPVARTRKVNGKDTAYWTGSLSIGEWLRSNTPPEPPDVPDVEVDGYVLTATIDNIGDARSEYMQFQVYDLMDYFRSGTVPVRAAMAAWAVGVNAGGSYRVRARAGNAVGSGTVWGPWSDFSSPVSTAPSAPSGITAIRGASSTSVYLEWAEVNGADTYDVEWATRAEWLGASDGSTTVTGIEGTHYTLTGLESGSEYFCRVRAVNDLGESGWTSARSVVIGEAPTAPTTWSSDTTVIVGETVYLHWVHNGRDGSAQTYAQVEVTVDDSTQTHTVSGDSGTYALSTSSMTEGASVTWRVRTAGITTTYGPWSVSRSVEVCARPTLDLRVTDRSGTALSVVTSFPFYVRGLTGPSTQVPIGYHVTVTADEGYQTVDQLGRAQVVTAGQAVFSQYVDTNDELLLEMDAGNVDLESGVSYTVEVVASMDTGLTVTESAQIGVSWEDASYPLDAEIAIDELAHVAYVTPYSRDESTGQLTKNLSLAVYRREFDGGLTEVASGLDSSRTTTVTDPHPSLDYARYRIVATDLSTGARTFYDPPGYPVGCLSVVIQWDEEWGDFEVTSTDERATPPWSGSLLELPYNIQVQESGQPDVALVEYAGREHPVSYHGTQRGQTASWSVDVLRDDADTLYALRRLQAWAGDAYVREPRGAGYWASVDVSMSWGASSGLVPVTLGITRVEGGA